jgi:hypothetical protein
MVSVEGIYQPPQPMIRSRDSQAVSLREAGDLSPKVEQFDFNRAVWQGVE